MPEPYSLSAGMAEASPPPPFIPSAGSGHTAVLDLRTHRLWMFGEGEDGQLVRSLSCYVPQHA